MSELTAPAPPELRRVQNASAIIGVVGVVLLIVGAILSPKQFFHSYLAGYMFWLGITLGCLSLVMLQHAAGGAWGLVIRRVLESATRTLPLMLLLFIPIALGMYQLYEWTHADVIASKKLVAHKQPYLNVGFFLLRAAIYFAVWLTLSFFLNKWSREQDHNPARTVVRRLRRISAPGIILYALTVTFASIDWVLSLDPEWFSTIFGLLFVASQALIAMAFTIAVLVVLGQREPMSHLLRPNHFHDLGKLLLAFVMLWAYFNFSQFLIIWSGNLPEEIPWYLRRLSGGWGWVALAIVIFHFALPFVLLLSRDLKRDARRLVFVALAVIVMRFIDLVWLIAPQINPEIQMSQLLGWLLYPIVVIGIGGIWLAVFVWQLRAWPLLPLADPALPKALEASGGH